MKTLIIPDVHQRVYNVEKALNGLNYDRVIFTGDWFDSFYEPPLVSGFEQTCIYLRSLVLEHPRKDDFTFLVGNHDINYIFNNSEGRGARHIKKTHYYSSGYTQNKCSRFRKTFFEAGLRDDFFIEHFDIAVYSQGWLLSHAGFIPEHIPYGKDIGYLVNELIPDVWENFRNIYHPRNSAIAAVGVARGGRDAYGGPLWLDWYDEFYPHQATGKQIVGHTTVPSPRSQTDESGEIICWNLDTELFYGMLEDGILTYDRYDKIS